MSPAAAFSNCLCGSQEQPAANGAPAEAEGEGGEPEGAPPAKKARTEAGTDGAEVRPRSFTWRELHTSRAEAVHLQEAAEGAADAPPAKKPRMEAGAEGAQARSVKCCLALL